MKKGGTKSEEPMQSLSKQREEIDRIDREMRRLFCERMQAADRIGGIKSSLSLPICAKAREEEILAAGKSDLPDGMKADWEAFQKHLMSLSRERQARIAAPLRFPGYDVTACRGALSLLPKLAAGYPCVCLIFDGGIPAKTRTKIKKMLPAAHSLTLPGGEEMKTERRFVSLIRRLTAFGIGKDGLLVGIGGGAVLDLVGFTAGVFLRGVDFLSVPTTLLADVDASVGGKSAVDFAGVKNRIGLIRRPVGVLVDTDLLSSLPERQIRAGLAEIVKIAAIADEPLFAKLEAEGFTAENTENIVFRAISLKKRFVEEDEADAGIRHALNFGHTVGHAVEAAGNGRYLHGEAVALGMLPMCAEDVKTRLCRLLSALGLATDCPLPFPALREKIMQDKKAKGDSVVCVLCDKIGSYSLSEMTLDKIGKRYETVFSGR